MAEKTTLGTWIIEATLRLFTDEDHPAPRALARLRAELAAARERERELEDGIDLAWGVIANAAAFIPASVSPTWQEAACRWRTKFVPAYSAAPIVCTGIAASWCPIHGNCTCREFDVDDQAEIDDDLVTWDGLNRPDCPIHGTESNHPDGYSAAPTSEGEEEHG